MHVTSVRKIPFSEIVVPRSESQARVVDFNLLDAGQPASTACRPFMPTKHSIQQWYQTDNPSLKRGVVNMKATFRHHLFEITQTQ